MPAGVKLDPASVRLIRTLLDLEERLSASSEHVRAHASVYVECYSCPAYAVSVRLTCFTSCCLLCIPLCYAANVAVIGEASTLSRPLRLCA